MNATRAVIVTVNGVISVAAEDLETAASARGYTVRGYHSNPRTRAEMQCAPQFNGLCGPMYGGPGIVRYEDPQMNEVLSR